MTRSSDLQHNKCGQKCLVKLNFGILRENAGIDVATKVYLAIGNNQENDSCSACLGLTI